MDRMKELISNKAGSLLIAFPENSTSLTQGNASKIVVRPQV